MKTKSLVVFVAISILSSTTMAAQFEFNPRPFVSSQYTDNLFLDGSDEDDDYIFTLSPAFDVAILGKTAALQLSYEPAYQFYQDNDDLDDWTHDAQLFVFSDFTERTRFDLANRFLLTRDPLGDVEVVRDGKLVIPGDPTNRTGREEFYTNVLNTRVNHQFGADDSVNAAFLYSFLRNDDPQVQDNDRYEPSVGLNYWFGPKFGTELRGRYTRGLFDQASGFTGTPTDDFDNWFGSIRGIGRISRHFSLFGQYDQIYRNYDRNLSNDYLVYTPSAGFLYLIEEDFTFRFGLGYFYQEVDGDDDNDGFYPNAEVNKVWDYKRGFIDLNAQGGLDQRNFGAQNIGLERFAAVRAEARYNFTRNFEGLLFGRFRYSDPTDSEESGGIEERFRTGVGAGLGYRVLKWMTLGLNYRYSDYAAEGDENWTENRVTFQVILSPDQPWKF